MALRAAAKRTMQRCLAALSLELHRTSDKAAPARATQAGALAALNKHDIAPRTVVDVGAASGTPAVQSAFPDATHVLLEPLQEFEAKLATMAAGLQDAKVVIAAAGPTDGEIVLNVHPDLFGSSPLREVEESDVNGFERVVPQVALDRLVRDLDVSGPYFIKIDTQGYELEVLEGATDVLQDTVAVLLEVSLFKFFDGGPQLADVVLAMRQWGFVAYDIVDHAYRPLDGALAQVDVLFVPETGGLRQKHEYATADQRSELTELLLRETL